MCGQMIDLYDTHIATVLLFTLVVFLVRLAPPLWAWLHIYHHVVSITRHVNLVDFIDFKTLSPWYLKTTWQILMKFT